MEENLNHFLEPVAAWFRTFNMPAPIIHWGHPLMMSIVVFVMGSYVAYAGWRGRVAVDPELSQQYRTEHAKIAPLMFLFIALGYTGGVLSLVMQRQPILESPHFWTGTTVLLLLASNAFLAFVGFGGDNKVVVRTIHGYLGAMAIVLLVVHAVFGLNLGLSI